jgi:phosphatidylserine decarboxylase
MRIFQKLSVLLQYVLPQHALSRLAGKLAQCSIPWVKNILIRLFIFRYAIDLRMAEQSDIRHYTCFNHFFTRALKMNARPIDPKLSSIISPVDGTLSQMGKINKDQLIQAKKIFYSTAQLLTNAAWAEQFNQGYFATIYLSPRDYHRVHMPLDGKLIQMFYIPGKLFSVNPTTTETLPHLFTLNERLICLFETAVGKMALIFVGAMIVAGIVTRWQGKITAPLPPLTQPILFKKGDELGHFELGSTILLLFEKDSIAWENFPFHHPLKLGQKIAEFAGNINEL